jgi:uncharacterized coiled-coil protein SlyX
LRNIEQVDIQRITNSIKKSLTTITKVADGANLKASASTRRHRGPDTNRQLKELVAGPELKATLADGAAAAGSARQILERAEKPLNQLLADLPKALDGVNRMVQRLDSASADLPDSSAQLKQTLQRLNRLIANQQYEIQATVQNLRAISESFKEITDNSKNIHRKRCSAPPPPSKVMDDEEALSNLWHGAFILLALASGCVGIEEVSRTSAICARGQPQR